MWMLEINFLVLADADIGEFYLTKAGRRGLVVRFVSSRGTRDLAPEDRIDFGPAKCGPVTAADLVATWGSKPKRIEEARQAALAFLHQWPEGPQID
jgi:hypothetical protein